MEEGWANEEERKRKRNQKKKERRLRKLTANQESEISEDTKEEPHDPSNSPEKTEIDVDRNTAVEEGMLEDEEQSEESRKRRRNQKKKERKLRKLKELDSNATEDPKQNNEHHETPEQSRTSETRPSIIEPVQNTLHEENGTNETKTTLHEENETKPKRKKHKKNTIIEDAAEKIENGSAENTMNGEKVKLKTKKKSRIDRNKTKNHENKREGDVKVLKSKKKRLKQEGGDTEQPLEGISDARLAAYGVNPKKIRRRLKYKPNKQPL